MSTQWFYPGTVVQEGEVPQHVMWNDSGTDFSEIKTDNGSFLITVKDLLHIANPTVNDLKMKTYYLYCTNFNFQDLPDVISGIEVELSVKRGGRITDETIQLMSNGEFIGDNKANSFLDIVKTYGGETDNWDIPNVGTIISNPSFGVGLRFQSHPSWPHKESPKIDYVKIRVW